MSTYTVNFASEEPLAYHVVDMTLGIDLEAAVDVSGTFSYGAAQELDAQQMRTEFMEALGSTLLLMSELGLSVASVPHYTADLMSFLNQRLEDPWAAKGAALEAVSVDDIALTEESDAKLHALVDAASQVGAESFGAATMPDMSLIQAAMKPAVQEGWVCPNCGCANTTKFCGECGTPRP